MVAVIDNMAARNVQTVEYNGHQHHFVKSIYGGEWSWWKVEHFQVDYSDLRKDRDLMISLVEAYYKNGYDIAEMPLVDFINACVNDLH